MSRNKVDFFIAGVQKGGTTALYSKLRKHPDICLPEKKELHFFDNDAIDWDAPDYDMLHRHFEAAGHRICGEATPVYLYWPDAIRRISEYNPAAKIIVSLRHPTFRALSAWKMEVARGAEKMPFGLAVSWPGRARVKFARGGVHRVYSYVERGYYARQIAGLLACFPRAQVLFITSDQLWNQEDAILTRICAFLGVAPERLPAGAAEEKYVVPVNSRHVSMKNEAAKRRLNHLFKADIAQTSEITGLDLHHWCSDAYREPMRGTESRQA